MSINPLPLSSIPSSSSGSSLKPSVSLHAQDLSTMKLQQKIDREQAKTSITHVGQAASTPATSSITRVGSQNTGPTTSISHPGVSTSQSEDLGSDQEVRDRLRYQYIRKMAKERQTQQAAAAKTISPDDKKYTLNMGTGVSFSRKIRGGFDKTFGKMVRKNPASFKNISKADRKVLGDIVQKHAGARRTGTGYLYGDRKRMKIEVEQARKKGTISTADSKDMKKIVDKLS
ncbi:MAG: hypothetical protein WCW16_01745 [Candidatus Magasanikbacteria bacterium]